MKVIQSKILNEVIVVVENREEHEEALEKVKELDATLYTAREIEYMNEGVENMTPEEKRNHLVLINKLKKIFLGFYMIPKNWSPKI
jgi:hypothetical protein